MNRAGYDDDCDQWELICYRGAVASAIRGKRGQAFLRELRSALDAMSEKRLIAEELVQAVVYRGADDEPPTTKIEACALGVIALRRGLDISRFDYDDYECIHLPFGIANALAREIIWNNDESYPWPNTPEQRWRKMRWWVEANIERE